MENIYIKEKKISFQDFFDQDDDMKVMKIKNDNSRLKRLNNFLHNYLSHNGLKKLQISITNYIDIINSFSETEPNENSKTLFDMLWSSGFPSINKAIDDYAKEIRLTGLEGVIIYNENKDYRCPRCKNYKNMKVKTMQVKSLDEGSDIFVECSACGHKWKR